MARHRARPLSKNSIELGTDSRFRFGANLVTDLAPAAWKAPLPLPRHRPLGHWRS